jgi:hypothetical protein
MSIQAPGQDVFSVLRKMGYCTPQFLQISENLAKKLISIAEAYSNYCIVCRM